MLERISMRNGVALIALAVATACGGSDEPASTQEESAPVAAESAPAEPAAPATPTGVDYAAEAKEIFDMRCTSCHGALGAGDGPRSGSLDPMPRNYRDPEWQESVTDDEIRQVVLFGSSVLGKSDVMPGNPDLVSQTELVDALVRYVRSFKR
jgi:mono/diheme cytochrome c family protein